MCVQRSISKKNETAFLFFDFLTVGMSESRDFMVIVLYGGYIRVVISLGGQSLTLTMSRGPRLDDGEWHSVEVRQELKVTLYFRTVTLRRSMFFRKRYHMIWQITTNVDDLRWGFT